MINSFSVLSDVSEENCKEVGPFCGESINVVFHRNTNPHFIFYFFSKRGSTRVHFSKSEHCCVDNSVTANLFFRLYILVSPLSSYIVAAPQKEYEIFIGASCVEGTFSTW